MRDNITLGEVKARCMEMTDKYGEDDSCNHCEFAEMGCCLSPDDWKLEPGVCEGQPNWKEMCLSYEEEHREMYAKLEEAKAKACAVEVENLRLRTIVGAIETLIGRKF